jgi:putative pyruvate formate lyase activating enzyme
VSANPDHGDVRNRSSSKMTSLPTITTPRYLELYDSGEMAQRAEAAWAILAHCELCPQRCGANRLAGEQGVCRMGAEPKVSSWNIHRWEEPPISGRRGSGTVFFSGCTGHCLFCQNYPISQLGYGNIVDVEQLASMMLELQRKRVHNINFVTPTHFMPQILAALLHAIRQGLRLPLVYNSSGYETVEALRLLDGIVDVWLPDAKYDDDRVARRLSGFHNYVEHNRAALQEIYRQVGGALIVDEEGIAQRGMIIRHLVLPHGLAGTAGVLHWIAQELSPRVRVSLMDQYFPAHRAIGDPEVGRHLTAEEYEAALEEFDAAGLECGWRQQTERY